MGELDQAASAQSRTIEMRNVQAIGKGGGTDVRRAKGPKVADDVEGSE